MDVASAGKKNTRQARLHRANTNHQKSRCVHWRENTPTLHGEITPVGNLFRHFVKADRTVYHLPSSKLHREVNSQRFCYFHEPFNVASKDIHIIYHSETSQKTPFAESMLKNPVYFLFFPPSLKQKKSK